MAEALRLGSNRKTLYAMRAGVIGWSILDAIRPREARVARPRQLTEPISAF